jgi:outer membrane protein
MKRNLRLFALVVAMSTFTPVLAGNQNSAFRHTLLEIYHKAQVSDPEYQASKATWLATKETLPENIAAILPSLSATASTAGNRAIPIAGASVSYHSKQVSLALSQTLINLNSFLKIYKANYQVKQAAADFAAAEQSLITRVATAYFTVLLSEDKLRFTEAEMRATARQLDQAQQRYKVGLVAITAVYEARAAYDQIRAQQIAARNNMDNSREQLRKLTGSYYDNIAPLKQRLPLVRPTPDNKQSWVDFAIDHNYSYASARFAEMAAKADIGAQAANHLPSLSIVGSTSHSMANGSSSPGIPVNLGAIDTSTKTVGLQLSVPILSGGLVLSQTRESQHRYELAQAQREAAYRDVMVTTSQTFNTISSGISKIEADRRSIESQYSSVNSTEAAYKVGTRTIVDVLQAQRDLYSSEQTHAEDQYALINNSLLLKQLAGNLTERDLVEVDALLRKS